MNKTKLIFAFLILTPLIILVFIVLTNIEGRNNKTDNVSTIPFATLITVPIPLSGQIILTFNSFDSVNSQIEATSYEIVHNECDDFTDVCYEISYINKQKVNISVNENTIFNINIKSKNGNCAINEINPELSPVLFNDFIGSSCNFFNSKQMFLLEENKYVNPTFTEYTYNPEY